jgi:maltose alpha-D-glucosyltransferase/alpha-amylase
MIRLRKELPEIGWGAFDVLDTPRGTICLRYEWQGRGSVFVHDLAREGAELTLDAGTIGKGRKPLVSLLSNEHHPVAKGAYRIQLEPYGYDWLKLGGLEDMIDDDAVRRSGGGAF